MAAKKVISSSASNDEEIESSTLEVENKKLKTENTKLKKNIESMSSELAEVKKMIESLNTTSAVKVDNFAEEDVLVCSLCVGSLSVGTESYGRGTVYNFSQFGEEQEIPFGELRNIVRNNRSFAEDGAFYVEDEVAVKKLRLGNAYKHCLSADQMKNIMTQTSEKFVELYDKASALQKENIVGLIVEAQTNGQFVDANILSQIGQRANKDLINID